MSILYKRKQLRLFAKITLFVFSFAWAICTSHISLPLHSQAEQKTHSASEEQTSTHSASCIDHTYQISARNQGNPLSGDQNFSSIPIPSFTFNFSLENTPSSYLSPHSLEPDTGSRLFLENKVLRL